ncbi:MAG: DUF2063 domain-containing protein [Ketobacter sp.]|nr:MAG: DUF2063 domain-containing protein [Ketobacter sp.]
MRCTRMLTDLERKALQNRQRQLVNNLFDQRKPAANGLMVYRNSLLMNAARALSLTYPVMTQLIGEQAMTILARKLLLNHPPHSGDWAEWGGELSDLVRQTQALAEMGFLQDVARLEWVLHQVGRASPAPIDVTTLQHLEQIPLNRVRIHVSPAIARISSDYPLEAIWRAHRHLAHSESLDHRGLAEAVADHQGESHLLIYQQSAVPRIRPLSALENQWFIDIQRGLSVAELLDRHPQMDFAQWLSDAIAHRWITHLSNHFF